MGLDKKVLRTRAITAVVFTAVMLAGLLTHKYSFMILCTVIAVGSVFELWRLAKKQSQYNVIALSITGSLFLLFSLFHFMMTGFPQHTVATGFGNYYAVIPCCILFSIWINDTMAYLVGSLIGKTPLSKVSPKKTVEGTFGGAVLAVIVIGCFFQYLPFDKSALSTIFISTSFFNIGFGLIALVAAVFGTLGDLIESKLKRIAGEKDSGSFMPGHGGFLDRFDSLLLAGMMGYFLLVLLG